MLFVFYNESQSLEGRQPVSHSPSYAGSVLNCKGKALRSPRSLPLETAFPLVFVLSDSRPRTGVRRHAFQTVLVKSPSRLQVGLNWNTFAIWFHANSSARPVNSCARSRWICHWWNHGIVSYPTRPWPDPRVACGVRAELLRCEAC